MHGSIIIIFGLQLDQFIMNIIKVITEMIFDLNMFYQINEKYFINRINRVYVICHAHLFARQFNCPTLKLPDIQLPDILLLDNFYYEQI